MAGSPVEPGEGAFDDPAVAAEASAVLGLAAGDHRLDAALPDEAAVLVVVVAAVGEQRLRSSSRPADATADRWHAIAQIEELGDVVAIAARERPSERDTAAVYEQVVLASTPPAIDRARTGLGAPFFACRWLASTTARDQSG
jgi:hypothetical protein